MSAEDASSELFAALDSWDAPRLRAALAAVAQHPLLIDRPGHGQAAALHVAATHDNVEALKLLLSHGAYVNVRTTEQGFSPLHLAASVGGGACIEALLASNGDLEARDWRGNTPLAVAAAADQPKAVRVLLRHGANVHAVSESGKTAIHSAAHAGSADCLRLLLDAGAHIEARTAVGSTPAHIAAADGHDAVLRLLLRAGADANAASTGPGARTPLMLAARHGHESCVEVLLKHRAIHTDARDACDWNALMHAAANGQPKCVALLLRHQPDLRAMDQDKNTSLHLAAMGGHASCINALLKGGGSILLTAQNQRGHTAHDLAKAGGHSLCASLLWRAANAEAAKAAAQAAADAAAAALMEEEEEQEQRQASKAAAKAAKRQRQKERARAAADAEAAAAVAEAAAEEAAAAAAEAAAEEAAAAAAPAAAGAAPTSAVAEAGAEQPSPEGRRISGAQSSRAASERQQQQQAGMSSSVAGASAADNNADQHAVAAAGSSRTAHGEVPSSRAAPGNNIGEAAASFRSGRAADLAGALRPLSLADSSNGSSGSSDRLVTPLRSSAAARACSGSRPARASSAAAVAGACSQPVPPMPAAGPITVVPGHSLALGGHAAPAAFAAAGCSSMAARQPPGTAGAARTAAAGAAGLPPWGGERQLAGLLELLHGELVCPITQELLQEPVVAADGGTYERAAILAWIARQQAAGQQPCSPLTGAPLAHTGLVPNLMARTLIAALADQGLLSDCV